MERLLIRSAASVGLIVLMATVLMAGEPAKQDAVKKDMDGIQGRQGSPGLEYFRGESPCPAFVSSRWMWWNCRARSLLVLDAFPAIHLSECFHEVHLCAR